MAQAPPAGATSTAVAETVVVETTATPADAPPPAAPVTPATSPSAETPAAASAPALPTLESLQKLIDDKSVALNTVWVLLTAFLVMWMQAGFALVETGLTRVKNSVNILMKNLLDFCFGSVLFWLLGFGIMFGGDSGHGLFGQSGLWMLAGTDNSPATADAYQGVYGALNWTAVPLEAKFFFQLVFAATAATIVSGAMAERTRFTSYMLYSIIISAVIYPVSGHWIWGGGYLASQWGFFDFAGSTVVHSVGGWIALVGAVILGARKGKYGADRKPKAIPGHNIPLVALGVFILWLGWFGFNPGSTMAADPGAMSHIVVTTNTAGAVAAIASLITAKLIFGKWEATMALNGVLAGLVAITAPCAWVSVPGSIAIGAVAGVLVVLSVLFFDHVAKIDDPVGAVSVHGVCGAWGTLSLGLFSVANGEAAPKPGLFYGGGFDQLISQAVGVGMVFVWCLATGALMFLALKYTVGLRVSEEEEYEGLDVGEHGNSAYHGFMLTPLTDR